MISLSREHLPRDVVYDLLLSLDPLFAKRLEKDVDIAEYSIKLAKNAMFEIAYVSGVVGLIAFYENKNELYITYVCVSIAKRRMGVADMLLHSVCCYADDVGKPISLEVWVSNTKAISLYEKYGFEKVKVGTEKYYMTRTCRIPTSSRQ